MNQSLGETLRIWRQEQLSGSEESFWQFLVRTNPWVFAHHPADSCFLEHVWTVRGLHFCKGCMMTVAGWLVALVMQISTGWLHTVSIGWIAVIFVAMLLPSVITALFDAPRAWKHVARVLLGMLMLSAIWLCVVTDYWWVRGVIVVVYFGVKVPLDRRRRRQNERERDSAHASLAGRPSQRTKGRGRERSRHAQ